METPKSEPDCIVTYKAALRERHSIVEPYGPCAGHNKQNLDDVYVDVVIVERWPENEAELESHLTKKGSHHQEYLMELEDQGKRVHIPDLFQADQDGKVPKRVWLDGIPGIGKTLTAQRLVTEWAYHRMYDELFTFVFFVRCSEIVASQREISLTDVLLSDLTDTSETLKELALAQPERVLLILDGVAEVEMASGQEVYLNTKLRPQALLGALLERKVFLEASLLITSRPGALSRTLTMAIDRRASILGFSEVDKGQYFNKFFHSEQLAAVALDCLQRDVELVTLCFIPLMCHLVCKSVQLESGSVKRLETTTQLLTTFCQWLLGNAPLCSDQIRSLAALALYGIHEKKVIFDEQDLSPYNIHPTAATNGILNCILSNVLQNGPRYSFAHVILQELFAAAGSVIARDLEQPVKLLDNFISSKGRRVDFDRCWFELCIHNIPTEPLLPKIPEVGHFTPTIRFIFGLMNAETSVQWNLTPRPELLKKMLAWSQRALKNTTYSYITFLLFGCLYEIHDDGFVRSALEKQNWVYVHDRSSRHVDYVALAYCVQRWERMDWFCSSGSNLGIQGLKALLSVLPECFSKLDSLDVEDTFGAEGIKLMCPYLKTLKVTKLSLSNNNLTDECMNLMFPALQKNKKLRILVLPNNDFREGCVPGLLGILKRCSGLKQLVLSGNKLGDEGVRLLSKGLEKHGSKLEVLWLGSNGLTDACAGALASALEANPSLSVELGRNSFTDESIPIFLPVVKSIWSYSFTQNRFSQKGIDRLKSAAAKQGYDAKKSLKLMAFINKLSKLGGGPH